MGPELAAGIASELAAEIGGNEKEREELANAVEAACMEGRCSVNASGAMQVQPDRSEQGPVQ